MITALHLQSLHCKWKYPSILLVIVSIFSVRSYCFAENAEGKYISPFHDIPLYANESQVSQHLSLSSQNLEYILYVLTGLMPYSVQAQIYSSAIYYPVINKNIIYSITDKAALGNGYQNSKVRVYL